MKGGTCCQRATHSGSSDISSHLLQTEEFLSHLSEALLTKKYMIISHSVQMYSMISISRMNSKCFHFGMCTLFSRYLFNSLIRELKITDGNENKNISIQRNRIFFFCNKDVNSNGLDNHVKELINTCGTDISKIKSELSQGILTCSHYIKIVS